MPITGRDLIERGYPQGKWFGAAIAAANKAEAEGADVDAAIRSAMPAPAIPLRDGPLPYHLNIRAEDAVEDANIAMVTATMNELMRVPTIVAGAVMPDACPAGSICVGGVVAAKEAIHPGFHSADICCSMGITVLGDVDPANVMDVAFSSTHFGYGGRKDTIDMPEGVLEAIEANSFTNPLLSLAKRDFASQGDGNHFLFVGTLKSTGETAIVTHHGSRGFGAAIYKAGMTLAEKMTHEISPDTPRGSAWIPSETREGEAYWQALQVVGEWTEESHFAIHDLIAERLGASRIDRWWNEHNFVFRRSDGLFYHAKGATPGWSDYDLTLVPLNMAEPVLVTKGTDAANGLGFLPHGAGRNMSRTRYLKETAEHPIPAGIDVRFFSGTPDLSELPGAYKNAASVRAQIGEYGLAEIVDEVLPYGTIMAGELPKFWIKDKAPTPPSASPDAERWRLRIDLQRGWRSSAAGPVPQSSPAALARLHWPRRMLPADRRNGRDDRTGAPI
jgi:RNA-splicing ligase RtcB